MALDKRRMGEAAGTVGLGRNTGDRFWVVTVFWDSEGPDNPIPERYLGSN